MLCSRKHLALANWCAVTDHSIDAVGDLLGHSAHDDSADPQLQRQSQYFLNHRDHLDYQAVAERGAPIGSGAVESQCSQFQDRFKRTGQFWTRPGLRNLLALHVMTQNKTFAYLWN